MSETFFPLPVKMDEDPERALNDNFMLIFRILNDIRSWVTTAKLEDGAATGVKQAESYIRIYDDILTAPATNFTVSNLTGDTDIEYIIEIRIVNGYDGAAGFFMRFNNDSGANYGLQYLDGSDAAATAGRLTGQTSHSIGGVEALGDIIFNRILIYAEKDYRRSTLCQVSRGNSATTIWKINSYGGVWNNTADELTSIVFLSDQTDGFGIGTRAMVFQRV